MFLFGRLTMMGLSLFKIASYIHAKSECLKEYYDQS